MIDEEIEKTLKCCDSKDWKCEECPIAQKCKKMAGDISFFYRQVIKYINRLKAENEKLKEQVQTNLEQAYEHNNEECKRCMEKVEFKQHDAVLPSSVY